MTVCQDCGRDNPRSCIFCDPLNENIPEPRVRKPLTEKAASRWYRDVDLGGKDGV